MTASLWWLGQNTMTVALLIPLVQVACRLVRHRPAVQHVLWVVVLLKFLTPPIVSWPWSIQQVRDAIWPSQASALPAIQWTKERAASEIVNAADAEGVGVALASERPDVVGVALSLALVGWLAGAAVCMAWQIRRIARQTSLIRRGTAASEHLMDEIRTSARRLGLRPPPAVLVRGILSPFIWCMGRLRLVWPQALSSQAEIVRARGIIAHELAHIHRGDHLVAWLELAAGVVWWWNPLFWFVRGRLRETEEMACDALAIATWPENRRDYAELLLELSAGIKTGAPAPVLAVSAGTPSSFERRLSMILSDRVSGKLSSWGILAAVCLGLVALPGWSLGLQQERKADAERPEKSSGAPTMELPAACLAGISKNVCMSCHGTARENAAVAYMESLAKCHEELVRNAKLERENARLLEIVRQRQSTVSKGGSNREPGTIPSMAEDVRKAALEEKSEAVEEYKRSLKLFEARLISQQQLDVARARVERASAGLNFAGSAPRQDDRTPKEALFGLQHAKAAAVSRILNELFANTKERGLRITADERMNCILVQGRATDVEALEAILTQILTHLDKLAATESVKQNKGH